MRRIKNNDRIEQSQLKSYNIYLNGYDDSYRLDTYKGQIEQVIKFRPNSVLEIGIGNKTVYNELRKKGINIISMDINILLRPDVVGNIICLPFKNDTFDLVLCAEVLEHLPFEDSMNGLKELKRVSKKFIILTLPQLNLDDRFFRKIKSKPYTPYGDHYWELGSGKCSLRSIKKIFKKLDLKLLDCYGLNVFRLYRFPSLSKALYKFVKKSRFLKFNGYPIFFILEK